MKIELGEEYHVWLNPILYHPPSTQSAETPTENRENRDPSSDPPRTDISPKPGLLTILNTILHMFHLQEKFAEQIKCSFASVGCVFTLRFIQGVVGVTTLLTPWSLEQEMQVRQRINERMHMFHFVLDMVNKGKTTEEIAGLCLHNGYSILGFSEMEQLEGRKIFGYGTGLDFLTALSVFFSLREDI